jgi:hypothetical protein
MIRVQSQQRRSEGTAVVGGIGFGGSEGTEGCVRALRGLRTCGGHGWTTHWWCWGGCVHRVTGVGRVRQRPPCETMHETMHGTMHGNAPRRPPRDPVLLLRPAPA